MIRAIQYLTLKIWEGTFNPWMLILLVVAGIIYLINRRISSNETK
ncbi:hypothetical protein [Maribellus maritimus]|nr:hypothetical protein [Maribellus maritimus]